MTFNCLAEPPFPGRQLHRYRGVEDTPPSGYFLLPALTPIFLRAGSYPQQLTTKEAGEDVAQQVVRGNVVPTIGETPDMAMAAKKCRMVEVFVQYLPLPPCSGYGVS